MTYQYENVKLEKGMYGQNGKSFLKVLEGLDPSESYREAVEALKETLSAEQEDALRERIAAQTQAYIEDKAASLGLNVRAEVRTAIYDGVPLPDSATLYGEKNAALGAYITQELGITEEKQRWIEPD